MLSRSQYCRVTDEATGEVRMEKGEQVLFLAPTERADRVQEAVVLTKFESVRVTASDGAKRVEVGPLLFFPGVYDTVETKRAGIQLSKSQYVRVVDEATGELRVEHGEQVLFLGPTDVVVTHCSTLTPCRNGVTDAFEVHETQSLLVASSESGQQRLVTTPGMFIPQAYEEVKEVRGLVYVKPNEAVVVLDEHGTYTYHNGQDGNGTGTSFFLPPHAQIVTMTWSSGRDGNAVEHVSKIDMRSQYLFFEFEVRTVDNVKLRLEGAIFWQVSDVAQMIGATKDPRGDVWNHARNVLIQAISAVTLAEFMSGFNYIVNSAFTNDAASDFYSNRGLTVHSMEVTSYECVDGETAAVLQEIIRETTNRINRLQQQESENEVQAAKLTAEITRENQLTALLTKKAENARILSQTQGESEGGVLAKSAQTFLDTLETSLPNATTRLDLYKLHQELKSKDTTTSNLASGKANLFVTPEDVHLKLDVQGHPGL